MLEIMGEIHKRSKILVLGGNGFLGSEIRRLACEAGVDLRCAYRHTVPVRMSGENVVADIRNLDEVKRACEGVSVLINATGMAHVFARTQQTKKLFCAVNEQGAANVSLAAVYAGVQHLVLVSSVAVYGVGCETDETRTCRPSSDYGQSKARGEDRTIEIVTGTATSLTILRPSTIYGENDPGNLMRLVRALDQGRFIWVGSGTNRKSLIYRTDAARACLTTALHPPQASLSVYNVSADCVQMLEIVACISEALGKPFPTRSIPAGLALGTARFLTFFAGKAKTTGSAEVMLRRWLADEVYDSSRFRSAYGFNALVSLHEGISRQVSYYRDSSISKGR